MNCTSCLRNNKINTAAKFCVECQEYFCTSCVQMHGNFSVLSQHSLLELDKTPEDAEAQTRKSGSSNVSTAEVTKQPVEQLQLPTERCLKHPAKVIDMYCKTHDTVGCSVCFVPHYRACDDTHYIPDIAEKLFNAEVYQREIAELGNSKQKLEKLTEACLAAEKQLLNTRDVCIAGLKTFRKEIDELLDELEKTTLKEIEQKYNEHDKKFKSDRQSIEATLHMIENREEMVKVSDSNKSVLFVHENMCKNLATSVNELCRVVGKPIRKAKLFFKGDHSIKSHLNHLSLLGSVRDQKFAFGPIKEQTTYDIKVETDVDTCNIWGTCITGNGNILIADNSNNNLKLMDKRTYKVVSSCKLSASPRSLSKFSDTEAAVSLSNRVIQFVSTEDNLSLTRSLQMEHNCFGLEMTQGHIFISDGSHHVRVYDMDGHLLRTIFQDGSGENIFSESRDITASDDGTKIHVADSRKGLITLDFDGNVVWRYSGSELKGAYGLCTDGEGHLLVTGILSHNVVVLRQNGEKIGAIICETDGVKSPVSVCFDRHNSSALVTRNGNNIIAFEFF